MNSSRVVYWLIIWRSFCQHQQVSDYTERSEVELFNLARGIRAVLTRMCVLRVLSSNVRRCMRPHKTRHYTNNLSSESAKAMAQFSDAVLETEQRQLKQDVDEFFIDAAQSQYPHSALDYLVNNELPLAARNLLFQVL